MSSLPPNNGPAGTTGNSTSAANAAITSNGPSAHSNGPIRRDRRVLIIVVPGGPPNSGTLPPNTPLPKKIDTAKRRLRWVNKRINQLERRQSIREGYDDTLFRHITNERRSFSANRPPTEKDQTYFGAVDSLRCINKQQNRTDDRLLKYLGKEKKQELCRLEKADYRRQAELSFASSKRIMGSDRRTQLMLGRKGYCAVFTQR
ncbi:hypothetical protein DFP73DRAFT_634413 [Morchella snyderi]|nr:hypothetical protein DFP73DRAFT_634413 [Morchella snyderi]